MRPKSLVLRRTCGCALLPLLPEALVIRHMLLEVNQTVGSNLKHEGRVTSRGKIDGASWREGTSEDLLGVLGCVDAAASHDRDYGAHVESPTLRILPLLKDVEKVREARVAEFLPEGPCARVRQLRDRGRVAAA